MDKKHLPLFGVGPYLMGLITIISILSIVASIYKIIPVYNINKLNIVFIILGITSIIFAIVLWVFAILNSKLMNNIKNNNLVTTGVYSFVAHPIYSCFLFISIGLILISQNILLFFLPFVFWAFLTISLIKTEEKWLIERYGDEYIIYLKNVNRFIPFKKIFFNR